MPVALRLVDRGLAQAQDAVLEHAAALAEIEPRHVAALVALARDDLVAAFLGEEAGPFLVAAVVDAGGVLALQLLDAKACPGAVHPGRARHPSAPGSPSRSPGSW